MGSSSRKRSRETYRPSASPHTDDLCRKVLKANANARIPTPAAASLDYKSADKSGSDRSSKSKETLGSGIAGSVVKITTDTSTYVRKKFFPCQDGPHVFPDFYKIERHAYGNIRRINALIGQVPKFHGQNDQRREIYLEWIQGRTFLDCDEEILPDLLQHFWIALKKTVQTLHKAGIAHGDIRKSNILVRHNIENANNSPAGGSMVLIDFSCAKFKEGCRQWERACNGDWSRLRSIFSDALERVNTRSALLLLHQSPTNAVPQEQLARLIKHSLPNEDISKSIHALSYPEPVLILALARGLRPYNRGGALSILKQYKALCFHNEQVHDHRSCIMMRGDIVCWAEDNVLGQFPDIISCSLRTLGPTDPYTLQLKESYAEKLEKHQRQLEAYTVFSSMMQDLRKRKPAEEYGRNKENEHVFKEPFDHQKWIDSVKREMTRLACFCTWPEEVLLHKDSPAGADGDD